MGSDRRDSPAGEVSSSRRGGTADPTRVDRPGANLLEDADDTAIDPVEAGTVPGRDEAPATERLERGLATEVLGPADHQTPATPRSRGGPTSPPSTVPSSMGGTAPPTPASTIIHTVADAMRDEEVTRTRLFIRVGWLASLGGIGALPFVDSGRAVTIAFVAALVLGMVVSFGYHQAFRDPRKYTDRAMFVLGVMSTINTHVAILFFGAFTLAPLLIVIGLHFIGRSELSMRRPVVVTACACHAAIALALITGLFSDPGVFATERPLGTVAHLIGAIYVQAAYVLAYVTGQNQRRSSLRSIEQLQRATRIASQRAALLDELRADLARAQQIGTGRYTGQVVGGFRLGMIIGRGAHGEVYDATQIADGAVAAVKLLHRDQLMDPTAIARFLREVRATASLDAPNIVRVLATSEPDAALPFMAMEKLSGLTLAEQLRRTPTLSPVDASTLVTHVAAGLDAARAAGIVHRDLKPQNLLCAGGIWKVLDFGVASLGDLTGTLTKGGVVGTPQYMAPEQARGARIDHRADLYALGAIAYRVLTGRNAFSGADTPALLYAVVHTMPVAPSSLADLPPDVDRWLALAMAKDPEARWPTGAELAEQFARALRGELSDQVRADAARVLHMTPWRGSAA